MSSRFTRERWTARMSAISSKMIVPWMMVRLVLNAPPSHFACSFREKVAESRMRGYFTLLNFLISSVQIIPSPTIFDGRPLPLGEGFQWIDFIDENVLTEVSKTIQMLCLLHPGEGGRIGRMRGYFKLLKFLVNWEPEPKSKTMWEPLPRLVGIVSRWQRRSCSSDSEFFFTFRLWILECWTRIWTRVVKILSQ